MSAAPSLATGRKELPSLASLASSYPLVVALALTAFITAVRSTGSVDSDVAWQLWIAGRLHAGAKLYTDIIETNPPLWFWMAVPVERLADLLHVRIDAMLVVWIGALIALSLAATNKLICHAANGRRTLLLCYIAVTFAAMPWMHVGQREQIVLITTVPYAALVARRREGRTVAPLLAIAVGSGAALGFALKHYFVLVPTCLEVWLICGQWRQWRPLRPEVLAIVTVGLCYAAAILFVEPEFLIRVLPLIRLAYGDFGARHVLDLFGPFVLVAIGTIALLGIEARTLAGRSAPLSSALTIAALVFSAVYFVQFKGWPYQAIAMTGCASIALASLLAEIDSPQPKLLVLAPALLALPLILAEDETRFVPPQNLDLAQALSGLHRGDAVGFLTTENAVPWSVTLQGGYRYPSRYDGFWMMDAIVQNERHGSPDPRLSALGRQVTSETVADFTCIPPKRIIVSRPLPGRSGFDILLFFRRDPEFAVLMSHYRLRSRTRFAAYDLISPLPHPTLPCRNGI